MGAPGGQQRDVERIKRVSDEKSMGRSGDAARPHRLVAVTGMCGRPTLPWRVKLDEDRLGFRQGVVVGIVQRNDGRASSVRKEQCVADKRQKYVQRPVRLMHGLVAIYSALVMVGLT